jgi:uncharacterized protein YacL (UPF0231 family)
MSKLRFYRDEDNAPRALGSDEESRVLAQLLESDIQDDTVTCRELLKRIHQTAHTDGPLTHAGNSFTISWTQQSATICNLPVDNDKEITLNTDLLMIALKNWLSFIS